jgi:AraC family ethanolamine operon transcriptional activator
MQGSHRLESGSEALKRGASFAFRTRELDEPQLAATSIAGASLEHVRLSPGRLAARLVTLESRRCRFDHAVYTSPVAIHGRWAGGSACIGFGARRGGRGSSTAAAESTKAMVAFDGRNQSEIRLPRLTRWTALTADQAVFAREVALYGGEEALDQLKPGTVIQLPNPVGKWLDASIETIVRQGSTAQALRRFGSPEALEEALLAAHARAFVSACRVEEMYRTIVRRRRLVNCAEEFVRARIGEPIRVRDLCKAVGASARLLEYAFQDVYQMGAIRYLRAVRLHEVRKALQIAAPTTATVTTIAMDLGFWHLGEFAAAYKRLFGESPRDTLRRKDAVSRGERAHRRVPNPA